MSTSTSEFGHFETLVRAVPEIFGLVREIEKQAVRSLEAEAPGSASRTLQTGPAALVIYLLFRLVKAGCHQIQSLTDENAVRRRLDLIVAARNAGVPAPEATIVVDLTLDSLLNRSTDSSILNRLGRLLNDPV